MMCIDTFSSLQLTTMCACNYAARVPAMINGRWCRALNMKRQRPIGGDVRRGERMSETKCIKNRSRVVAGGKKIKIGALR